MNLQGKTIILTGAGRIGQTVAEELAKKGTNLAISYLAQEAEIIGKLADKCQGLGVKALSIQADLTKSEEVDHLVSETIGRLGHIDGLVHMAAIYQKSPWESLTEADWNKNLDIIAKSAFLIGRAVGSELQKNQPDNMVKGKMIFISDWSVLRNPYKDHLPYNVAKSAVVGLTLSLAKELAPDITVNCLAPGPTIKPADLTEEENKETLAGTPLNRWGGPAEIAKAVLYLLDADFITGVILPVDGGRSIA